MENMFQKKTLSSKDKMAIMAKRMFAKPENTISWLKDSPGKWVFYDQFSGKFFRSSRSLILAAELAVNRELATYGVAYYNTFCDVAGLHTDTKKVYGWDRGKLDWIDFDHILVENDPTENPYYLIVMIPQPKIIRL